MQALVCDKPKLNPSIYSSLVTIVKEEGIFRPIQVSSPVSFIASNCYSILSYPIWVVFFSMFIHRICEEKCFDVRKFSYICSVSPEKISNKLFS